MVIITVWNDIAYLGRIETVENQYGDIYDTIAYNQLVYCNKKSIRQSEFYQAQAVGLKPTLVIEIMLSDYDCQEYVKFNDEEYSVLRTYETSRERIELTLTKGVTHGNA